MGSRPSFFRSGLTKARFQRRGKQPDSSERLINLVIGVSNTSRHSVKSLVRMGSREQVVFCLSVCLFIHLFFFFLDFLRLYSADYIAVNT